MGTEKVKKYIVPAMKAFIVKNGKALLLSKKRSEDSDYDIPGGRIEFGEEPEEALEREVREETNLSVKPIKPIAMTTIRKKDMYQVVATVFLCKAKGKIKLSDEHTSHVWVALEELKTKKYPEWLRKIAGKI